MVVSRFPPIELADEDGLLAAGGDLDPETLILAYSSGIFPWPWGEESPLLWFAPPERGVLFLDQVHLSRSLRKVLRNSPFTTTIDTATRDVIKACATAPNRAHGPKTWITSEMIDAYSELAVLGFCHSVESWREGELVGGVYGIALGGMFAAESMFYREPNASKVALVLLIDHLRSRGCTWIDCQQLTPTLEQFGGREIPRETFMELLGEAIRRPVDLFGSEGRG